MNAAARPRAERQEQPAAADVGALIPLAREKLKALPRYAFWKKQGWHYTTVITFDRRSGHVCVLFDLPDVTDNAVFIEIDPILKSVISVQLAWRDPDVLTRRNRL